MSVGESRDFAAGGGLWLRVLAGAVVALVGAAALYAVAMAIENFHRIGV